MPINPTQLTALQQMTRPTVGEILAVYWSEDARGTKYYSFTALDDLPNFKECPLRPVEARLSSKAFQKFELSADISDEYLQLDFEDIHGDIGQLFHKSGEGTRAELFYQENRVRLQPNPKADYGWSLTLFS